MIVDIAVVALVAILALVGFLRGLFSQAWGLAALAGAYLGTPTVVRLGGQLMGHSVEAESVVSGFLVNLGAGIGLYIALVLVGRLIEVIVIEQLQLISAGNRVLGGVLGLAKGCVIAVMALWASQFAAAYVLDESPKLVSQLQASAICREIGGYNPLNFVYLSRLSPYLLPLDGAQAKPLPESIATPELERLVTDEAFAQAYRQRDYMGILLNPAYQVALRDPLIARRLNRLY